VGTITISIDDELAEKLRRVAERFYGSRRGMSKIVENALRSYLAVLEKERNIKYIALKEGSILAEASTLSELADKLKALGVEPRGLRILRSSGVKSPVRGGYRLKSV
jgi:metal-responsive CopG/Arc/MetJ family transcriptional regulator